MKYQELVKMGYKSLGFNFDNEEIIVKTFEDSCTFITIDQDEKMMQMIRMTREQFEKLKVEFK